MPADNGKPRHPFRLLIVIGTLDSGGTERHLLNVLPLLDQTLVRPEIFVLGWPGQLADEFEARGVSVIGPWIPGSLTVRSKPIRAARLALVATQLFLMCLLQRPAIVHFFLPTSYILGGVVALSAMVRRRIMSRRSMNNYQAHMPAAFRIERWLHPRMTALVGNSQRVVEQLIAEGASPDRVTLIFNGVHCLSPTIVKDRNAIRRGLTLTDDATVFVMVANLIPYKGHLDLLKALSYIKTRLPEDWRLLVVGRDDGMGERMKAMVEELQIQENVMFLGSRNDVPALLVASDIGILCSHEEGFSNAILESMAAGLPMIVSDVGGNAEAVVHGETGLVVPARDPEALGEAVAELASAPGRCRAMGQAGRLRIERFFSMESCVANYNRLYEEILSGKRRFGLASG